MRLLVTRPEPDAEATAERLRMAGHEVLVAPLLSAVFPPPPAVPDPAAVAVTSRNGVRALAGWRSAASWHDRPVFAVGHATALAARAAGFRDVRSADGDGMALGAFIARTMEPSARPIIYPAAEDRSPGLERSLAAAGFRVAPVVAYRMIAAPALPPAAAQALRAGRLDGVLLYSARTARTFVALAGEAGLTAALARLVAFVLSPAVGAALGEAAFAAVHAASHPDEEHLLALLPAPGAGG